MTGPSDDGQAGVTDRDRETALFAFALEDTDARLEDEGPLDRAVIASIAAALAAERAKARAPFLALADELVSDDFDPGYEADPDFWTGISEAAYRIRRAAEEGQR